MDEPESMGSLTLASREKLDNLIFVINCNLQRLDGPVRGNGKVIQELEAASAAPAGTSLKWSGARIGTSCSRAMLSGALQRRLGEIVDGEFQTISTKGGAFIRENLFNTPELRELVAECFRRTARQPAPRRP